MKIHLSIWSLVLCTGTLLLITIPLLNKAHATTCSKKYISPELSYLSADVIFSGYDVKSEETGKYEWRVTELFKGEFSEVKRKEREAAQLRKKTQSGNLWLKNKASGMWN